MSRIESVIIPYRDLALDAIVAAVPLAGQRVSDSSKFVAGSYVVSDKGAWFAETDQRLGHEIGFTDPIVGAIGYAIRNMGFVKISFGPPDAVTITFHPRNTDANTIRSVTQGIECMDLRRFDLCYLAENGWVSESFATKAEASGRLEALCGVEMTMRPEDRWHLTALTPDSLSADEKDSLRLMHQKWRISFGTFSESVFSFAMQHGLLDRLILAGARRPDDDLVFRYIGDDFGTFYSDEFRFNAIGTSIVQQPDRDYGEWVGAAYKAVAQSGAPRLDYIDACLPGSLRGPWIRYERLLLPWKLPTGGLLVSISSRINSDRMLTRPS